MFMKIDQATPKVQKLDFKRTNKPKDLGYWENLSEGVRNPSTGYFLRS